MHPRTGNDGGPTPRLLAPGIALGLGRQTPSWTICGPTAVTTSAPCSASPSRRTPWYRSLPLLLGHSGGR